MNSSRTPKLQHDLIGEVALLDEPGGDSLRLHFDGPFEGQVVRWQAVLFTPAGWAATLDEALPEQNIIDIHEDDVGVYRLNLCLKVTAIDLPTVRKAVMMVRQYKRLRVGRHRYG